ncbi:hypothetical protein [Streptomyces sp. NBC_00343]|nr:hypothetical protein [Streptomyces sp. NBC_00343]
MFAKPLIDPATDCSVDLYDPSAHPFEPFAHFLQAVVGARVGCDAER